MNSNHYDILGVARDSDAETIKRAYRKLAGQHHPDRGGDTARFQEIQNAYETLSDPNRRAQYDQGGQQFHQHFGGGHPFGFHDIFSQMFGQGSPFHRQQQQFRQQTRMTLWVSLADVAAGERRAVSVGTHGGVSMVEIDIPVGIEDGATVQYAGIAPGGGDLLVTFRVHTHPTWQRDGFNMITDHVIDMWHCILGGECEIRDVQGNTLSVTVPPRCQPGTVLRLRGRGMRMRDRPGAGDILVRIQTRIPDAISDELMQAIHAERKS